MKPNDLLITEQKFDRVVVFFYCLLILFLPVSIALVEIAATFVILIYLAKQITLHVKKTRSGHKSSLRGLLFPQNQKDEAYFQRSLNIYIACILVSVIFSRYPSESWIAFYGKLLEGYFLYVAFIDCVRTKTHFRNCVASSVVAASVLAVDGLAQFFFGTDFLRRLPLQANRVSATLRHANDFGGYLIAYIPIIFGLLILPVTKGATFVKAWHKKLIGVDWMSKIFLAVTFLLMLACLGLTFSRGSWVGFWFSLLIFVLVLRKFFMPALAVCIIFVAVFLPFLMKYRDVSFTTDSVNLTRDYKNIDPSPENLQKLNQVQKERVLLAHKFQLGMGRFGFWEEATTLIKKHPFFGSGLNTYSKLTTGYAHNCYLQMAAETGLIGLLTFLAMIGVLFWQSFRLLSSFKDPYYEAMLASFLGGLGGFLVQSFFDTTLYSVQLGNLLWVLIAFVVAIPRIARSGE